MEDNTVFVWLAGFVALVIIVVTVGVTYTSYLGNTRQTVQMKACVQAGHQWVPTNDNGNNGPTYQCIK